MVNSAKLPAEYNKLSPLHVCIHARARTHAFAHLVWAPGAPGPVINSREGTEMLFQGGDQGSLEDGLRLAANKPTTQRTNHNRHPGAATPDPSARSRSPHPFPDFGAHSLSIHGRLKMQKWHIGK